MSQLIAGSSYKLLPKAMKGKMNVAVILNPSRTAGFNFTCCKCCSVDFVLDMDLFFYISNKRLCYFF